MNEGQPTFVTFSAPEISQAQAIGDAAYDAVVFEMEHGPYDIRALRDCMQYMLNRRQIVTNATLAPAVTPFVRIPPNGGELNQWIAKQVLDSGVYGVIWPHVSTVEDARNAVVACRYPRPKLRAAVRTRRSARRCAGRRRALLGPDAAGVLPARGRLAARAGRRGAGGHHVRGGARDRATCRDMLREVPGIGVVLIGEGDLSQDLGYPRQYEHPTVAGGHRRDSVDLQERGRVVRPPARRLRQRRAAAGAWVSAG